MQTVCLISSKIERNVEQHVFSMLFRWEYCWKGYWKKYLHQLLQKSWQLKDITLDRIHVSDFNFLPLHLLSFFITYYKCPLLYKLNSNLFRTRVLRHYPLHRPAYHDLSIYHFWMAYNFSIFVSFWILYFEYFWIFLKFIYLCFGGV